MLYAAELRRELAEYSRDYAAREQIPYLESYGGTPIFFPFAGERRHGNFLDASYRAILKRPAWSARMEKPHTGKGKHLPAHAEGRRWRELDSAMSSDALLMNVFCCPGGVNWEAAGMPGAGALPEFGFKARVPLAGGRADRTEVDLKLGGMFIEAKLTESDFQAKPPGLVERYRDLEEVLEIKRLPRAGGCIVSYQLVRNVLAAHASGASLCVLLDARRPDLIAKAGELFACVRHAELKTRCKLLTWQELSTVLPPRLRRFLAAKYGI